MKRYLVFLLFLSLLLSGVSALADLKPATVVITIDGVRTAFFAENGDYLSPMKTEDGIVYVPVLSLAESLGLDVSADARALAVTINGVRTAFFSDDGAYMEPVNVDGTLYVPLVAFTGSAGISLTMDGDSYMLTRGNAAKQKSDPQADASVAVESYGNVPVTLLNYEDYFHIAHSYYAPDNYKDRDYRIILTATASATTSYDLINVRFLLDRYGIIIIPANGEASSRLSLKPDEIYAYADPEEALAGISNHYHAVIDGISAAESYTSRAPVVQECSGFVRMSAVEARSANEKLYQKAKAILEGDPSSAELQKAVSAFDGLAEIEYLDSEEQAVNARSRYTAALQSEKDELIEEAYQDAMRLIDEADYFGAIAALDVLAKTGYNDSAERAEALRASLYDQATSHLESGEYDAAVELFEKLAVLGYRDSADLAVSTRLEGIYTAAKALEDAEDYDAAIEKYRECNGYRDSANRITACEDSILRVAYGSAKALEESGEYLKAKKAFLEIKDYSDSYARASECLEKQWQYALSLIPEDEALADQAFDEMMDSQLWESAIPVSFSSLDRLIDEYKTGIIDRLTVTPSGKNKSMLESEFLYSKALNYIREGDVQRSCDALNRLNGYRSAHCLFSDDPELRPTYEQINLARFNGAGNIVLFGRYEQDGDLSNGQERIQWAVLDVQDGKALLISRFLLEVMPFNDKGKAKGWENSTIRKWLNGDFYQQAFTDTEKAAILETELTYTTAYQGEKKAAKWKGTKDRVFFLLKPEIKDYLAMDTTYNVFEGVSGWYTARYGGPSGSSYTPVLSRTDGSGENPWLTREQAAEGRLGSGLDAVFCMNNHKKVNGANIEEFYYDVDAPCGIRPTIWVRIDAIPIPDPNSELLADDTASIEAPTYSPLSKGSNGDAVKAVQQKLIDLGYLDGKADGDYGNKTLNAVKAFQADAGLEQTGVADSDTQAALFGK